jgi:hypothetical protein
VDKKNCFSFSSARDQMRNEKETKESKDPSLSSSSCQTLENVWIWSGKEEEEEGERPVIHERSTRRFLFTFSFPILLCH